LDDKILEELLETEEEKKKRRQDWVLVISMLWTLFFVLALSFFRIFSRRTSMIFIFQVLTHARRIRLLGMSWVTQLLGRNDIPELVGEIFWTSHVILRTLPLDSQIC
jgi:hypothetical protein